MALLCKVLLILFIIVNQNHFGQCDGDDLNINVDGFMDAFDNAYPTETSVHVSGLNEAEVPAEVPDLAEASLKTKEEPVIKERMLPLGENVQHTLTENVQTFAENILTSISSDLRLVKVTGAASTTYPDKVQRELSLVVSRHGCAEGDKCEISCRVELVSGKDTDHVTWHNCLDTQNGNEIVRTKRGAVGGFKQVDENEAKELADVAVQTLDSIDADDIKRVVTRVIRAQKQLVNGIMYHLTLEVASSDCKEDSPDCEGGALFDHQTCKILMQRHFSGEAPYHAQVIKSECSPAANVKETEGLKKRAKRSSVESNNVNNEKPPSDKPHHNTHKMGGIVSEDPNSEKIIELAQFALDDIEKMSNSMNRQKIVRIVDARSQVVAGVKYYLKLELSETDCRKGSSLQQVCKLTNKPLQSCDVVIWDKPWKKFRVITRVSCSPAETRKKRGMLYGGLSAADPNDPKVQEMAQFAVAQLDAKSNSVNKQKLLVVKKAQTQVVAGSNYYLTIQLVETNCRKGTPSDSTCSAAPGKEVQECDVVVYDRPWENHRELTSAKCLDKKQRHKRDVLVGGLSPADPNDAKVQEMAQFAVAQLDAKSNSVDKQKLLVVKKAQTQVVSGTNYYLTIQLVETNCRKGTPSDSTCNAAPGKEVQECDVVVYDRPWENHRELTSAKCLDKKQRHKRDVLVGGLSPADPNDAKVQEMAQFAVAQLDAKSNSVNKQKLLVVKKAQTQVVAGVNYYLTIQLVETNCRKGTHTDSACSAAHGKEVQECDVVVYDRPWDKHRELTSAKCLDKNKQRHKRDVLVGGLSPADPNDAKVQEMAQFAVAQMDAKSNSVNKQKLLVVKKAQTQVVAGTNYYLTIQLVETNCRKGTPSDSTCSAAPGKEVQECDVVVYDRPWDKHQEITSVKCLDKNKQRHKRAAVPGGLSPADPNDAKVQEMAQFAVVQLDAKSNSVNKQKLLVVTKAETQVVAGVNYYLTIQLVETNCRKEAPSNSACSAAPGKEVQECEVVVYDRPWDKHRELTSAKCLDKKQHNKRALKYGGKTDADVNDENVQQMAQFALSQLDERSNSLYKQSLVRITKAQTEVVDGISYYLSLLLEETNCQKGTPTSSKCNAVPGKALQNCDVVVYNRPWEHHRELTKFSCSPASETKHLHKRVSSSHGAV